MIHLEAMFTEIPLTDEIRRLDIFFCLAGREIMLQCTTFMPRYRGHLSNPIGFSLDFLREIVANSAAIKKKGSRCH